MTNLAEKAMLVSVSISIWSGRKLDKEVTDSVNREHAASVDAGRYNKALVAPHALAEIVATANRARKIHYARSLPWLDDGARIMSAAGYLEFAKELRGVKDEFDAAVSKFIGGYGDFVDDARRRLNGMFKESDYPAATDIAGRFRFERRIWPLPASDDFRVSVGAESQAEIRREIADQLNSAMSGAMSDAFRRVAETVGAMAQKLAEFQPAKGKGDKASGIFRDSLVENVRELTGLLPSLNITGDARLAEIAERMKALCASDADVLREDADVRAHVQKEAAAIVAAVSDYF